MNAPYQYPAFPTNAFPYLVEDALLEVSRFVQAPMSMSASSFLSVMSAAVQQVADVRLPIGSIRPTSLFSLTIAESGERKSTVDELVAKPLRERDMVADRRFIDLRDNYENDLDNWKVIRSAQVKGMAKLAGKGEPTAGIEQKLADHDTLRPIPPRLRLIMRQDMTYAAIMTALEGDGESIFVCAGEGGAALKSELVQNHFAVLSMAWGGESILTDRAGKNQRALNPRCTLAVMVQDQVLREFLAKRGDVLRSSGFLARCLVTRPQSMIGYRPVESEPPQWHFLDLFHARLEELFDEGDMRFVADAPRQIIEFDSEACRHWIRYANKVEAMLRPGEYLAEVCDFGAKLMEHLARVAAILHVFSRQEGKITVDTIERAYAIVWFFAEEFRFLLSPSLEMPQAVVDADRIATYLLRNVWSHGSNAIRRNDVQRSGPVRGRDRFYPAIEALISQGQIWLTQLHRKAPVIINLNPQYFGDPRFR